MLPVYSGNTVNMHKPLTFLFGFFLLLFWLLVIHLNFTKTSVFIHAGLCLTSCLSTSRILKKQLDLLDPSFLWDYLMGFSQVTPWRDLNIRAVILFIGFVSFSQGPELHNVMWSHSRQSYPLFVPYLPMLGTGHECPPETLDCLCSALLSVYQITGGSSHSW